MASSSSHLHACRPPRAVELSRSPHRCPHRHRKTEASVRKRRHRQLGAKRREAAVGAVGKLYRPIGGQSGSTWRDSLLTSSLSPSPIHLPVSSIVLFFWARASSSSPSPSPSPSSPKRPRAIRARLPRAWPAGCDAGKRIAIPTVRSRFSTQISGKSQLDSLQTNSSLPPALLDELYTRETRRIRELLVL